MKNYKVHLQYVGTCRTGNKIWFSNLGFNGIFSMELDSFSFERRKKIQFLDENARYAYAHACMTYGDRLFFFPNNCKQIMVYNFNNDQSFGIPINTKGAEIYHTAGIIQWKEQVWIFPLDMEMGVHILNLQTLQLEEDVEIGAALWNVGKIVMLVKVDERKIGILSENNTILEVDVLRKQIEYRKCFENDIDIFRISYDGNNYWLLQKESTDICEWNRTEDRLIRYTLSEIEWIHNEIHIPYSNVIFMNDQIIVLPYGLKFIMKVDKKSHSISKAIDYPEGFRFLKNDFEGWTAFSAYDIVDDSILLHPMTGNMLLIYNPEADYITGRKMVVTTKEFPFLQEDMKQKLEKNDGRIYERDDLGGLECFLDIIDENHNNVVEVGSVGRKIYDVLNAGT